MHKLALWCCLLFTLTACHVGRTVVWNFGNYDDYKKFESVKIEHPLADSIFAFPRQIRPDLFHEKNISEDYLIAGNFEAFLKDSKTTSFIVLRHDTVIYEQYLNGYQPSDLHCVNSVSKSFLSLLVGIALEDGKINSLQDTVAMYISEFQDSDLGTITIEELLDMKSGIHFSEAYYNPFGNLAKFYYGINLRKYIRQMEISKQSKDFDYISVNTDILGWVLENAIGKTVPDYLEEKVWQPLQMSYDATWSIDSKKHNVPKFSYGLNVRTSDLLKLGHLYVERGTFNGKKLISPEWIDLVLQTDTTQIDAPNYKNHWWREVIYTTDSSLVESGYLLATYHDKNTQNHSPTTYKIGTDNYYAAGFLGQFVYVSPKTKTVIVRTGKKQGKTDWIHLFRTVNSVVNESKQ